MLRCSGEGPYSSVSWSKQGDTLPYNARDEEGVLTVYDSKTEDSGVFVCTVVSASGSIGYANATVYIKEGAG